MFDMVLPVGAPLGCDAARVKWLQTQPADHGGLAASWFMNSVLVAAF